MENTWQRIRIVLLDVSGTLVMGKHAPTSRAVMSFKKLCQSHGLKKEAVLLLSNNTREAGSEVAKTLKEVGFDVSEDG